jgi:hypothetical protein
MINLYHRNNGLPRPWGYEIALKAGSLLSWARNLVSKVMSLAFCAFCHAGTIP